MPIERRLKAAVKSLIRTAGFDVVRWRNSPGATLLGLRQKLIRTVIDVGANTGQYARSALRVFPEAIVYSFEPLPRAFEELSLWAKDKGSRVVARNVALGAYSRVAPMHLHREHSPSSSLLATTDLAEELYPITRAQEDVLVTQITLDEAMDQYLASLPKDVLLKLDAQGYEDRILEGGSETLNRTDHVVLEVCLDNLYEQQAQFAGLVDFLYTNGFSYRGNLDQTYAPDGHVIFIDALFSAERDKH